MHCKIAPLLAALFVPLFLAGAVAGTHDAATLIVPGGRIGGIVLGASPALVERERGEPAFGDAAMGGKRAESWYLGTRRGDKGRPFHRPDEIGIFCLKDMEHDSANTPGRVVITAAHTSSPRYSTAEGIRVGATLDEIRAAFPSVQPVPDQDAACWPLYGDVQFYSDSKRGIGFVIRSSDNTCVKINIMPGEGSGLPDYFVWGYPAAAFDYVLDDQEGAVGDIKIGMSSGKLVSLLGKPTAKSAGTDGEFWWWRTPAQKNGEFPGFCIYMRKLPDGGMIASQIRVSSSAFNLTNRIYPGCPLKDALEASARVRLIETAQDGQLDIYADMHLGVRFDIRKAGEACTAITLFSAPLLDYPHNVGR